MLNIGFEATEKILLYYPTIDIPSKSWIMQGIMYWDKIGSIVPNSYDEHLPPNLRYSERLQPLYDAKLFRPFNPEDLWRLDDWRGDAFEDFKTELLETLDSDGFQEKLSRKRNFDAPIHPEKLFTEPVYTEKINDILRYELGQRNLIDESKSGKYIYFERNAALVYMAVLAKHLANIDNQLTVPSTDLLEYERLNFKAESANDTNNPCLRIEFKDLLRVPSADVELERVIDFRLKHTDELITFRKEVLDKFQDEIKKCTERREIQDKTINFKNQVQKGVTDLNKLLNEAKFQTVTGTLKSILKPEHIKTVLGTGVAAAGGGAATGSIEIAALTGIAGLVIGAGIEITDYFVSRKNLKQEKLRSNAYSYLYLAQRELQSKSNLVSLNLPQ
jgi:hypothetical protein